MHNIVAVYFNYVGGYTADPKILPVVYPRPQQIADYLQWNYGYEDNIPADKDFILYVEMETKGHHEDSITFNLFRESEATLTGKNSIYDIQHAAITPTKIPIHLPGALGREEWMYYQELKLDEDISLEGLEEIGPLRYMLAQRLRDILLEHGIGPSVQEEGWPFIEHDLLAMFQDYKEHTKNARLAKFLAPAITLKFS